MGAHHSSHYLGKPNALPSYNPHNQPPPVNAAVDPAQGTVSTTKVTRGVAKMAPLNCTPDGITYAVRRAIATLLKGPEVAYAAISVYQERVEMRKIWHQYVTVITGDPLIGAMLTGLPHLTTRANAAAIAAKFYEDGKVFVDCPPRQALTDAIVSGIIREGTLTETESDIVWLLGCADKCIEDYSLREPSVGKVVADNLVKSRMLSNFRSYSRGLNRSAITLLVDLLTLKVSPPISYGRDAECDIVDLSSAICPKREGGDTSRLLTLAVLASASRNLSKDMLRSWTDELLKLQVQNVQISTETNPRGVALPMIVFKILAVMRQIVNRDPVSVSDEAKRAHMALEGQFVGALQSIGSSLRAFEATVRAQWIQHREEWTKHYRVALLSLYIRKHFSVEVIDPCITFALHVTGISEINRGLVTAVVECLTPRVEKDDMQQLPMLFLMASGTLNPMIDLAYWQRLFSHLAAIGNSYLSSQTLSMYMSSSALPPGSSGDRSMYELRGQVHISAPFTALPRDSQLVDILREVPTVSMEKNALEFAFRSMDSRTRETNSSSSYLSRGHADGQQRANLWFEILPNLPFPVKLSEGVVSMLTAAAPDAETLSVMAPMPVDDMLNDAQSLSGPRPAAPVHATSWAASLVIEAPVEPPIPQS